MKTKQQIIATTHVDLQFEKLSHSALESMARQINECYLPLDIEHDLRLPPVGRVVAAKIVALQDGESALVGTMEIFDESDAIDSINGDGRKIPIRDREIESIQLIYDRGLLDEDGQELIADLARISGKHEQPEHYVKKSLDPITIIIILAGLFPIEKIAEGFLTKLGEDSYNKLKSSLGKWLHKKESSTSEKVLDFSFAAVHNGKTVEVQVFITNPSEHDLEEFLDKALNRLDVLLALLPLDDFDVAQIVCEFKDHKLMVRHAIRNDAVPLHFMLMDIEEEE